MLKQQLGIISVLGTSLPLLLFFSQNNPAQAITLTTFSPVGFSDAIAGITSFQIEDFEDTTLISGLTIEWTAPSLGPLSILPATYNPTSEGFSNNTWDGVSTLNNKQQQNLLPLTPRSEITTFNFANDANSVGIGISNLQFGGAKLMINGVDFVSFDSFNPSPIFGANSRSIYIRVDADPNETINSIGIRGGSVPGDNDFLTFDRLAVGTPSTPIPEPTTIISTIIVGGVLLPFKRKLTKKAKN